MYVHITFSVLFLAAMWRSRRSSSSSSYKRHQIQEKLNISRRRSSVFGDVTDEREIILTLPASPSRAFQDSTWRFTVFSIVLGVVIFLVVCFSFYQRVKYILWLIENANLSYRTYHLYNTEKTWDFVHIKRNPWIFLQVVYILCYFIMGFCQNKTVFIERRTFLKATKATNVYFDYV